MREAPVSTFSIDVDTASYSWVRASLNQNVLPQPAAVRTEEMVNYFPYDYAPPRTTEQPFSTNVAVLPSPWSPGRKLVRIGIKGYSINRATRPHANLVFLIDTSGSMQEPNKLPLVKQSLELLLDELGAERHGRDRHLCRLCRHRARADAGQRQGARSSAVIDQLGAGGSTAGAEGIRQAYALAEANLDPSGVNRVILATDGDFNVGITDQDELKGYIEREREQGRVPVGARLRHGQLQRRADADAGAERQRHRRLHRHAVARRGRRWSRRRARRCSRSPRT